MMILRNWMARWASENQPSNGFNAPEPGLLVINGEVYGHPKRKDGTRITTSPVVGAEGRIVRTASGSAYKLEEPSPEYLAWLTTNKIPFDAENPIRMGSAPAKR